MQPPSLSTMQLLATLAAVLLTVACSPKQEAANDSHAQANPIATDTPAEGQAVSIAYVADPEPPRSGDNKIKVTLKQPDGAPFGDATVSVTYYMPAMPSMNMPEMRDVFALAHQGDGIYGGTIRLTMGGTWLVTVTASRGGETIASKRLTVIAAE